MARLRSSSMLGACAHNIGSLLPTELYHKQHVSVLFDMESSQAANPLRKWLDRVTFTAMEQIRECGGEIIP